MGDANVWADANVLVIQPVDESALNQDALNQVSLKQVSVVRRFPAHANVMGFHQGCGLR